MKRFLQSEVGAIVLWAISSLILAAILAPWCYSGGKQFAAYAANNELSAFWEWLAGSCSRAELGRYFNRAMLFAALCLLPLLIRRIRRLSREGEATPIIAVTPLGARRAILHVLVGCILAGGILWLAGSILEWVGAYTERHAPVPMARLIKKALVPAIMASVIEEWVFRGLLLGLWLRTARPLKACVASTLLFAFLHFLNPPDFASDPTHALAGFALLGQTLLHFANPLFFVTDFATLTAVGLILCWTRLRTCSLWFPIGLHAGWVLAFKAHNLCYRQVDEHWLKPWGIGDSLRSGLVPMLALAITAGICWLVLKRLSPEQAKGS